MTIANLAIDDEDDPFGAEGDASREDIQHRVDDWLARLDRLFEQTRKWAAEHGWTAKSAGTVLMNEELMQRRGVPPMEQPTLRLERRDGAYALFNPKALWVIGANGRIDLYTAKGVFVIIDRAEPYQSPAWRLFRVSGGREGIPYDPALLSDLT